MRSIGDPYFRNNHRIDVNFRKLTDIQNMTGRVETNRGSLMITTQRIDITFQIRTDKQNIFVQAEKNTVLHFHQHSQDRHFISENNKYTLYDRTS